jgi:SAM-dependent methyltransferase
MSAVAHDTATIALARLKQSVPRKYRYVVRATVMATISPFFAGKAVECPCCEKTARRWIMVGEQDPVCPHCSSGARHRLLALYLKERTPFFEAPLRVVHFAAEYCLMHRLACLPNLDYVPADLDPPRGAIRLDLTAIDLPTDSVDVVICSHVLEHVVEDEIAMGELRRIIRPGGQALIMVPVDRGRAVTYEDRTIVTPAARLAAFHQSDHVRIYGRDFPERLRSAGFAVEMQTAAQFEPWAQRRCGLPHHDCDPVYVCT